MFCCDLRLAKRVVCFNVFETFLCSWWSNYMEKLVYRAPKYRNVYYEFDYRFCYYEHHKLILITQITPSYLCQTKPTSEGVFSSFSFFSFLDRRSIWKGTEEKKTIVFFVKSLLLVFALLLKILVLPIRDYHNERNRDGMLKGSICVGVLTVFLMD